MINVNATILVMCPSATASCPDSLGQRPCRPRRKCEEGRAAIRLDCSAGMPPVRGCSQRG
jgi:hypothetical protein